MVREVDARVDHEPNEDKDQMVDAFETLLANLGMPEPELSSDAAIQISAKLDQIMEFIDQIKAKYPQRYFSILIHRIGKYSAMWADNPAIRQEIFIPIFERIVQLMKEAEDKE